MNNSFSPIVQIGKSVLSSNLSKEQKSFNRLTAKIEKLRKQLAAWKNVMPLYQQKYVGEFLPLLNTHDEHRAEMVRLLDKAYAEKKFTKTERNKLNDAIASMAVDLLVEYKQEDLKEIYNRHSGGDFAAEEKEGQQVLKSMMESMFGVELEGDIDINAPEKTMVEIGEKLRQQQANGPFMQQPSSKVRKKTAKQLAKEEKQREEAQNVSQSIREVYRKLASALHPDREQDVEERKRKTTLMQRVNSAYDNKDLLRLLELQLEIEQLDQNKINMISSDRLKHFNKVLTEQAAELQQEITGIQLSFQMRLDLPPTQAMAPETVLHYLHEDIQNLQRDIKEIKSDLMTFQDVSHIKRWLKTYRRCSQSPLDMMPFDLMDGDLFA